MSAGEVSATDAPCWRRPPTSSSAFGAHRRDDYFECFAPDATFVFHSTPGRLDSRAAYEALWSEWESESGFHVEGCTSHDGRVQVLGGTAVFVHEVETTLTIDGERSTVHERETIVFALRDGRWLGVHEHLSPTP